jgi:hypothetical protein
MELDKIINKIVWVGIILLCGYTIKKEIQKKYPELKKEIPNWIWRF